MTVEKKLGIWMDHSNAHLIEFSIEGRSSKTIQSKFTHLEKELALSKSENLMQNKEQHLQLAYYNALGDEIKHYNHVVLFGPTDAKLELLNTLRENHLFDKIKIDTQAMDKMTDNEQQAFVRKYFTTHI